MLNSISNRVRVNSLSLSFSLSLRSLSYNAHIDPTKITFQIAEKLKEKTPYKDLLFGHTFTDHMLEINWHKTTGWSAPKIIPYGNISISPASTALHYGIQCFEGMKAYKDSQGRIRLFRPDMNMNRLDNSMQRMAMPPLDKEGFIACMEQLIRLDASWVPDEPGYTLYLRPLAIGTSPVLGVHASAEVKLYCMLCPVGPYYKTGATVPVKLLADSHHVRAWPGGVGNVKVGGNYAPTIAVSAQAAEQGYSQVLWLFGPDHQITEVGAMNILFVFRKENNELELATAPLTRGDVLPGVTRDSILSLARSDSIQNFLGNDAKLTVSERWITIGEVRQAAASGSLVEVFGAGTAAIVSPVSEIGFEGQPIRIPYGEESAKSRGRIDGLSFAEYFRTELLNIQYGKKEHVWSKVIS